MMAPRDTRRLRLIRRFDDSNGTGPLLEDRARDARSDKQAVQAGGGRQRVAVGGGSAWPGHVGERRDPATGDQ